MLIIFRILLLAVLLVVLASVTSIQLLKATSVILGNTSLCGSCIEDVRNSLHDSYIFLKGAFFTYKRKSK